MKKLFTLLALTITFSINAQMDDNSHPSNNSAGTYSVAMGHNNTASGGYSTAMGRNNTASGLYSTVMGESTTASADYSTAMGSYTTASGTYSIGMGYYTTASGDSSTAMGRWTTASGTDSTAMGYYTQASGSRSTAMGRSTTASDYASTVIGQYNSSGSSATSPTSFSTSAPAFVIGNGADSSNKSDAFKVMFNGDTYVSSSLYLAGTAITATAAEINLLDGVTTIGDGILASVTESGTTGVRLSTSNASNHGIIGDAAVDLSKQGESSTTRGATGYGSLASGYNTKASGDYSTAMGSYTTASGYGSTALGRYNTASGSYSVSMGRGTTASDWGSLVIGRYNSSSSSATSADSFSTSNPAFVIGNGTDFSNLSDAFKVMFNGDTTVSNDLTVSGDVVISSDARLKSNIVSLGSTLPKLLQIDGKSYEMKGKQKIGVLAQEIQEVFPELVSEDDNEMLAVNYQGLVPVLINALKEQQNEINRLKKQEKRIDRLEKLVANID